MTIEVGQVWRLRLISQDCLYVVLSVDEFVAQLLCLDDGWVGQEFIQWMDGTRRAYSLTWERFA